MRYGSFFISNLFSYKSKDNVSSADTKHEISEKGETISFVDRWR